MLRYYEQLKLLIKVDPVIEVDPVYGRSKVILKKTAEIVQSHPRITVAHVHGVIINDT